MPPGGHRVLAFYELTPGEIRQGALAIASHTGWSLSDIMGMRTSKFVWWIEGLPRNDGK